MSANDIVQLEGLTKVFPSPIGEVVLFGGLSFTVKRGDFVAVTGATGCGKTTLLNIVAGLDAPTCGEVTVMGSRLGGLTDDQVTQLRGAKIGVVFQGSGLMPNLNVEENIELPLVLRGISQTERQRKTQDAIEFFGLGRKRTARIHGLSVGEKKKVAIARAVVTQPEILLLDEPTSGLDTPTVNILMPLLRGIHFHDSRTIMMATNNLETARIASREMPIERPSLVQSQENTKM